MKKRVTKILIVISCFIGFLWLESISSMAQGQNTGKEVAIIDPELPDVDVLVKGLKPEVKIAYFDKEKGILACINEAISENAPISALHVITHGMQGAFFTTYGIINNEALNLENVQISNWKSYFVNHGDILLYGCDIGKGTIGEQFCRKLTTVTGLDVAASNNPTGASAKGGDWNLELNVGNIETSIGFKPEITNYQYLLTGGTSILVYGGTTLSSYAQTVATYYTGKGYNVTFITGATSIPDLTNYALVCILEPDRALTATEISYLSAHLNKGGRIVLTGEHSGFATQNANVTSTVLALGGHLSIQNLMLDGGVTYLPNTNINTSSDIMEGVNTLWGNAASAVNIGGDAVVLNRSVTDNTKIVMAQERLGNGDIVAWADVNFWDKINDATFGTGKFFNNLVDKAILNIQSKAIAELTTTEAYSVGGTSAYSGGNITNDKGSAITERGICWSASSFSPTVSDHKIVGPGTGTGLFSVQITGLALSTKYYVRAYCINGNGTAYGNTVSFTTSSSSNTAPTAVADNFSCAKSGTITSNVMSNDYDADGDPMTAHIVVTPSYITGGFTLNANGSFSYTHNGNAAAADFFSYYLTDNHGGTSSTVGVSIALFTPSTPPVGADGSISVTAGVVYGFGSSDFTFSDATPGQTFNGIQLITSPVKGLLKYNGFAVADGSVYNDVTKLSFDNNSQSGGTPFATFTFKVVATSGQLSTAAYTMSINLLGGGKTDQTITFNPISAKQYGGADFDPGATASSSLIVTYASATPSVATIVNGKIRIAGVGTSVITASQEGDGTYNPAPDVTQTLTVNKADQTITFDALTEATYGDADISLGATSSSGLGITYSSTNHLVATIVSGKIHIVGAGTSVITAMQAGDGNYNAAANVDQTLTVNKVNQSITFTSLPSEAYGIADFNPGATSSSGLGVTYVSDNSSVTTIVSGKIHIVGVGSANITASQAGDGNYNSASDVTLEFIVTKAKITVSANSKTKTYGDANPALTLSYSGFVNSEDEGVFTTAPAASTVATDATGAGFYQIIPSGGSADNYSFEYENGLLTINQKVLTITADNKSKTFGDENPELTFTYSGFVGSDDATLLTTAPVATTVATKESNVGSYGIVPADGNDNNYSFNYVNALLTIGKKDITATADDKGKSYGDANPAFTISYTGFVNDNDESVIDVVPTASTTAIAASPVGHYTITLSGGSDNNYNFVLVNGDLVVNLRNLNITAEDKSKTYGDTNPTFTLTYSGFVHGDNESVLNQLPVISSAATQTSDAGTYDIVLTGGSDDYYTYFLVNGSLTIAKKELTVTADDKTKVYGEPNPVFTFKYTGFVSGEDAQVLDHLPVGNTLADETSGVSSYSVIPADALDNNYSFNYQAGNLSVTKKDLNIKATDKSKVYGDENPELTIDYNGFVNDDAVQAFPDAPIVATEAILTSPVGQYTITLTGGSSNNYNLILANGALTINKRPVTVTAENKTKVYGELNPSLTAVYTGFANGETVSVINELPALTTSANQSSSVGDYSIIPSGGSDDNYSLDFVNGTLSITMKMLTVTADAKYRVVNQANPDFTLVYQGFENSEGQSVLTTMPMGSTSASVSSAAGDYSINVSGGVDDNYDFTYVNGTLRITLIAGDKDGDGKITAPEIAGDSNCDGTITAPEVAGDTNGDGKITAPEIAGDIDGDGKIDGNEIAGDKDGDGKITAPEITGDIDGDGKITSPEIAGDVNGDGQINSTEIIGDINGDGKITLPEIAGDNNGDGQINGTEMRVIDPAMDHRNVDHLFSPNGDGFNDYWKLPEIEKLGRVQVKIYNRWGSLVYESSNYQNDWDGTSNGKQVPQGAYFYYLKSEKEGDKTGVINIVR